jgi:glycosyltransferase involved in cell wall biosynthesis
MDIHLEEVKRLENKFKSIWCQTETFKNLYLNAGIDSKLIKIKEPVAYKYDFIVPERNDNEIRLIYCGTLRDEENILEIIEGFCKIHKERPEVILKIVYGKIHGSNDFVNKLENIIKQGVPGITFKHNLSHRDSCYEIATSDIGICWRKNGWGENGEISTKVKEYKLYGVNIKNNLDSIIKNDNIVVLTNLAALEGMRIEDCVASAYDVIKSRQGSMVNGTFVKENKPCPITGSAIHSGYHGPITTTNCSQLKTTTL